MAIKTIEFEVKRIENDSYGGYYPVTKNLPADFKKLVKTTGATNYVINDKNIIVNVKLNEQQESVRVSYQGREPYTYTEVVGPGQADPWGEVISRVLQRKTNTGDGDHYRVTVRRYRTVTKYRYETRTYYSGYATVDYSTNAAPEKPSFITTSGNAHVEFPMTINWGAATDEDGDIVTYELSVSYSGSNVQTRLYTGPLTTYEYTLPTNISSVKYFVRATDGEEFTEYTETETIPVSQNASPVISGKDAKLEITDGKIEYVYQVTDPEEDTVVVIESLNGVQLRKMINASQKTDLRLIIPQEKILELPVGQENSIVIEATDEKGQSSYRRLTFIKTNSPPTVTFKGQEDLGEIDQPPTIEAEFFDPDDDPIEVSIEIDGNIVHKEEAIGGKKLSYTIPKDAFLKVRPKVQTAIILRVKDKEGETATKKITFTRVVNRIEIKGKHISKDFANGINKVFITLRWSLDEGAIPTVKLCNNALDKNPTWENFTKQVLDRADCVFQNTKTTNGQWALGIWVTVERGTSDGTSFISSIGGALK